MKEEEKEKNGHEHIIAHIREYLETTYELAQVRVVKKVTEVVSASLFMLIVVILGMLTLGLFSLSLASWLGELLESRTKGYLCAGGIYLLILVCFLVWFKKISMSVFGNRIIKKIYEKRNQKS